MKTNVSPLVPRTTSELGVPQGEPLPRLWSLWWTMRGSSMAANSRKTYGRTERLAATLPAHPSVSAVALWLAALGRIGHAPGTIELRRQCLAALYSWAMAAGLSTANPAALAKGLVHRPSKPDIQPGVREVLAGWPRILAVCDVRERAFLGVMRLAGLREEEALALRPEDVLQARSPWALSVVRQRRHVNVLDATAECKGRRGRELPVRPELLALLAPALALPPVELRFGTRAAERVRRLVPWLFPYRERDLLTLAARLRAEVPEAFPLGRCWHQFRRALALEMRAAGASIEDVRDVLGHESTATTDGYCGRLLGRRVAPRVFDCLG